ncbi:DUF7601 domain-containing protein [Catenisphaera adipataccumulans]|uniref:DUF7601 domain-containing protein n=1 Tax=Catenisphaera adipataccumulans TaxID=700500 RepID=A0A7W8CZD5_9FIRM|nr:DUF5979 domain-containing protein [Catenisphaera adipataccumulans]MBB5183228.1 hypothetical protein [Catenisphaera adipataccumulans]
MKRTKLFKVLLSMFVAVVMLAVPIQADTVDPGSYTTATDEQKTTTPFITKHMVGNLGTSISGDFKFTFTQLDTTTTTVLANSAPIADVTISVDKTQTETQQDVMGTITLPSYSTPGVYAYTVAESTSTPTGYTDYNDPGLLTFDTNTYTMLVYVNSDNQVIAVTSVNNSTGNKVTWEDYKGMEFTNEIVKKANPGSDSTDLSITKSVTGTYGDKTKKFSFTVTFDTNGTVALPTDWSLSSITATIGSDAVTNNSGVFTFNLKDGETINFNNIPAGVNYTVTETGVENYTATYTNTHGTASDTAVVGTKGQGVTAGSYLIYESGGNSGTMVNDYPDITITGILTDNAPFIAVIAFAAVALFLYRSAKKKAMNS